MEHYAQTVLSVILMSLLSALVYAQVDSWIRTEARRSKTLTAMLVITSVGVVCMLSTLALSITIQTLYLLVLNGSGG